MFKKPLGDLKTSAPLRTSDRRKLRQHVADTYALASDAAAALVPDGLLSAKFATHLGEPGTVYLAREGGDPLWFALGRDAGSDALIPTVYTLWKAPGLLPILTTPARVIPVLAGGADLMAPGVVAHAPGLMRDALVAIAQHHAGGARGPPLAVGRMAVDSAVLDDEDAAGKAVLVLHAWKDHLWALGKGKNVDPPDPVPHVDGQGSIAEPAPEGGSTPPVEDSPSTAPAEDASEPDSTDADADVKTQLSPEDVSAILRTSLITAIHTSLSASPPGTFPLAASQLYTAHLLPARPAHAVHTSSPIDIKHSAHKNLAALLKAAERDGLLSLKHAKGDVLVSVVHPAASAAAHAPYRTVAQEAARERKRAEREKEESDAAAAHARELSVSELWKPHQSSLRLFEALERDTAALYTPAELKELLTAYVADKQLANARDAGYVDAGADNTLVTALGLGPDDEFLRRDALLARLTARMQPWHEVGAVRRAGKLAPVVVQYKVRQGRKACTLVSGFELFGLAAPELAERLRVLCASSTSVQDLQGKNAGQQVMAQGRQLEAVLAALAERGVPQRWVKSEGFAAGKKKK